MITLNNLKKMKKDKIPVAWVTAYDYPLAMAAERAGIDMILVGDSGGMCQLGYKTTNPVTMDEMIVLAKSVRRGAPNTFVIGDMPQGSYEISDEEAIKNALRFVKEAGCNAVKLEGGSRISPRVKAISDSGILVMGHLGLTPQSADSFGGYRVQGKTISELSKLISDAGKLQSDGAFAILLEAMPTITGKLLANYCEIPIYGIGAGSGVDGQLLIMHDLLGLYPDFRPRFAKCYVPQVLGTMKNYVEKYEESVKERRDGFLMLAELAITAYAEDVKNRNFPSEKYCYPIVKIEEEKLELAYSEYIKCSTWMVD